MKRSACQTSLALPGSRANSAFCSCLIGAGLLPNTPKPTQGRRENAGRTVELIATRSVIAGTERRDIYRGQIEWCRNQLRQNGPHPPYSRQIVDLQAAIAADDDTPL